MEALLWIPLFFAVVVVAVQVTQISVSQARVMRIVQDGNRAFALGRLDGTMPCPVGQTATATNTESFIRTSVAGISPTATTSARVNCSTKTIVSTVSMPVTDLSGFSALPFAAGARVTVSAQQIKEF